VVSAMLWQAEGPALAMAVRQLLTHRHTRQLNSAQLSVCLTALYTSLSLLTTLIDVTLCLMILLQPIQDQHCPLSSSACS